MRFSDWVYSSAITLVVIAALTLSGTAKAGHSCPVPPDISKSIVRIEATEKNNQKGRASGVVISNGWVITAEHVTNAATKVDIMSPADGVVRDAKPEVTVVNEVSFLQVDTSGLVPVRIRTTPLEPWEHVLIVGYPLGLRETFVTVGTFQSRDSEHLLTTAPTTRGNSGGAVLDCRGNLIGIVQSTASLGSRFVSTGIPHMSWSTEIVGDVAESAYERGAKPEREARNSRRSNGGVRGELGRVQSAPKEVSRPNR